MKNKNLIIFTVCMLGLLLVLQNANAVTLFSDDFSGPPNAWMAVSGHWAVDSGEYCGNTQFGSHAYSFITDSSAWNDYWAEVKIHPQLDSSAWRAALIFRATTGNGGEFNYYQVHTWYDGGGMIRISKIVDGLVNGPDQRFGVPMNPNDWHTLAVNAQGSDFQLYYDGTLVWSFNDPSYPTGWIGLKAWAYPNYLAHVHFDDVIVTTREPVPEPVTMLLLGSGLVGIAGLRRKNKNKGRRA